MKSIEFRGQSSFKESWVSCITGKPVTIVIGRNNTGKSAILALVKACCDGLDKSADWQFRCTAVLTEQMLSSLFSTSMSGGALAGNHWTNHGALLSNSLVKWQRTGQFISDVIFSESIENTLNSDAARRDEILSRIRSILASVLPPYSGMQFLHLFADRDIVIEKPSTKLELSADGRGATNIIRRLLNSADPSLDRDLIQRELLTALNQIFGSDGNFLEICVKEHDNHAGEWEIYLGEKGKGLVALSRSGSGLKTVLLVLLYTIVIPKITSISSNRCVFAFEELENNLHPALMRRLLKYIEDFSDRESASFFLTTHSSTMLDVFGSSSSAGIVKLEHDGGSAVATIVSEHFGRLGIVSELGARPSDILQANGIIWVEGPSDAIYVNCWIGLVSGGELKEGRDYICAFYGGSLLARLQIADPAHATDQMVNILMINANVAIICDSDKSSDTSELKERVVRITTEVEKVKSSFVWVTAGKEIENYLRGDVLSRAFGLSDLPDPEQHEFFFPSKRNPNSYFKDKLKETALDKVGLAAKCSAKMSLEDTVGQFDLREKIESLVAVIRSWNA